MQIAELVNCRVIEHSEDIACEDSAILVEGQKEGQVYRFCISFSYINAVFTKHVYLLPSILEILDEKRGHNLCCLLNLKSGFYNAPVENMHGRIWGLLHKIACLGTDICL